MGVSTAPVASPPDGLPALFHAADDASERAQLQYLWLLRGDLFFLVLGGALTSMNLTDWPWAARTVAVGAAIALTISLVLTATLSARRPEQRWYGARAVAESVKTRAWRFMMAAEPYDLGLGDAEADRRFAADLQRILAQTEQFEIDLVGGGPTMEQITEEMREIRKRSLAERRDVYRTQRIVSQRQWYAGRAAANHSAGKMYLTLIVSTQLVAVAAAVLLVLDPDFPVNVAAILAAVAAALLAWSQARRHRELAQAYGVAAHELGLIADQSRYVEGESQFSEFVGNAEEAISREHTLWVARRDVPGVDKYRTR